MKKNQKAIFDALVERRDEILKSIGSDSSVLKQLRQDKNGDVVDFARVSASGEMSSQLAEVEMRELKNIETAIKRIHANTYGICEGCENSIQNDRLAAIPHASHCINCQRAAEDADLNPHDVTDWSLILGDASGELHNGSSYFGANPS